MNRNMLYFTQRVLSAATSAAVYVLADVLSSKARQQAYRSGKNQNFNNSNYNNIPMKHKYTSSYSNSTAHRTSRLPNEANYSPYRSMNEQARQRREKGTE